MENLEEYVKKQGTSQGYNFLNATRSYSGSTLIDLANGWREQTFFNKIYEVLFPSFRESERQAARYVLKERGIEDEEPARPNKPDYKQEFRNLGCQIKNVFYGLANLIVESSRGKKYDI